MTRSAQSRVMTAVGGLLYLLRVMQESIRAARPCLTMAVCDGSDKTRAISLDHEVLNVSAIGAIFYDGLADLIISEIWRFDVSSHRIEFFSGHVFNRVKLIGREILAVLHVSISALKRGSFNPFFGVYPKVVVISYGGF